MRPGAGAAGRLRRKFRFRQQQRRNLLRQRRQFLSSLAQSARERDYRLTHSEVKMRLTLDLGAIQKEIDALSKQFRELDTRIQGVNWTAELLD